MAQVIIKITDAAKDDGTVATFELSTDWVQGAEPSVAVQLGAAVMEMLNYTKEQVENTKGDG